MAKQFISAANVSSAQDVEVKLALGEMNPAEIGDVICFMKKADHSTLSDSDISFGISFNVVGSDGKPKKKKMSAAISQRLYEATNGGQGFVKVPYKDPDQYERSDMKGSPINMEIFKTLNVGLFLFDSFDKQTLTYPTRKSGEFITENLVVGLPDEFLCDPTQERMCNTPAMQAQIAAARAAANPTQAAAAAAQQQPATPAPTAV